MVGNGYRLNGYQRDAIQAGAFFLQEINPVLLVSIAILFSSNMIGTMSLYVCSSYKVPTSPAMFISDRFTVFIQIIKWKVIKGSFPGLLIANETHIFLFDKLK